MNFDKYIEGIGQLGESSHVLYKAVIDAGGTDKEAMNIVYALIKATLET